MPHRATAALTALGLLAALIVIAVAPAAAPRGPVLAGCPAFPASNAWNRDVSHDPVDPRSKDYISSIDSHGRQFLHPDFGGGGHYGIPYTVVSWSQPRVPIRFTAYGSESDRGPYPIPPGARIEEGSDRHVLIAQRGTCKLFELFN